VRIGIWCDYGFTLEPSEGIGVFVDNLVRGLIAAAPDCHLTLKAHPDNLAALEPAVRAGRGRVDVVAETPLRGPGKLVFKALRGLRKGLGAPDDHQPLRQFCDTALAFGQRWLESGRDTERQQIIATCDVWLLPYVSLDQEFSRPTVVAIHDLVTYHFPDMVRPSRLKILKRRVARVAAAARLVACMSNFIRDNDLIGTLHLPPDKLRVIPPAVPSDLQGDANVSHETPLPAGVTLPYLFYPASFRPYKNHAWLIEALALLKRRDGNRWKVVFTGIRHCPAPLRQLMGRLGVADDVIVLGKVSREQLQSLYHHAFATVVPSLYEQGSFPAMEALHCGCPAVVSAIPALQEQFAGFGTAMPYLDPADPASLAPIVDRIESDRTGFVAAQQQAFRIMQQYTWRDAAVRWLDVLNEAASRPRERLP
jgi:glycosyltransferase involved in cell wall biosynthesis